MPQPDAILKFKNIRYQQKLVFKIFADCESIIESGDGVCDNTNNRRHTPCAVGFKLVSLLPNFQIPYQSYRGENCIDWFLDTLIEVEKRCIHYLFEERPLIWDEDPNAQCMHAPATHCYLCGGEFGADTDENLRKVRDHDHLTGLYRGEAQSKCNIQ